MGYLVTPGMHAAHAHVEKEDVTESCQAAPCVFGK